MNGDELKRTILLSLAAHMHEPMHESTLRSACRVALGPVTGTDVERALRECEAKGYVLGVTEDLIGRYWGLTTLGKQLAARL